MAKRKKSRTPAPPRRPAAPRSGGNGASAQTSTDGGRAVQAPKVRTGKRRTQADTERRNRMILYGVAGAGVLGLIVALLAVFVLGRSSSSAHFDGPNVEFANLPGLMKTPPPWPKNTRELEPRLEQIGVQLLPTEGNVLHIHSHLDIFVNGKHITVPPLIGIKVSADRTSAEFAELHTHATDGVIHLESARAQAFSLGQFFGTWGLNLSQNCIGNLCFPPEQFKVYVNGTEIPPDADPVKLVLQEHDEIAIVYGTPPAEIPSSYDWPENIPTGM